MFIELVTPQVVDIDRTGTLGDQQGARTKIRIRETGAPGRLILSLTFTDDKEALEFTDAMLKAITRPKPAPST